MVKYFLQKLVEAKTESKCSWILDLHSAGGQKHDGKVERWMLSTIRQLTAGSTTPKRHQKSVNARFGWTAMSPWRHIDTTWSALRHGCCRRSQKRWKNNQIKAKTSNEDKTSSTYLNVVRQSGAVGTTKSFYTQNRFKWFKLFKSKYYNSTVVGVYILQDNEPKHDKFLC